MSIGSREKVIALIAAVVLVVAVLAMLLVVPQYRRVVRLDKQVAEARRDLQGQRTLLAEREAIKNRAAETDARWIRLANLVPDTPDLPSLIIELQDAAFDSGVQLIAISPGVPSSSGTYLVSPVQLSVIGSWADTVDYLQRLPKLSRGLRVMEFSCSVTDNDSQSSKQNETLPEYAVATSIKVEAYVIPPAATTPVAEQ